MVEDVAEGIIKVVARFLGQFFLEIILEILVKGPGYIIVRIFSKEPPDPDSFRVIAAGVVFWVVIGLGGYFIYFSLEI